MTQQTYVADRSRFRWAQRPPRRGRYVGQHRAIPLMIQALVTYLWCIDQCDSGRWLPLGVSPETNGEQK